MPRHAVGEHYQRRSQNTSTGARSVRRRPASPSRGQEIITKLTSADVVAMVDAAEGKRNARNSTSPNTTRAALDTPTREPYRPHPSGPQTRAFPPQVNVMHPVHGIAEETSGPYPATQQLLRARTEPA